MKKLVLVALGIAGAAVAKVLLDRSKAEKDAWSQATDSVDKA